LPVTAETNRICWPLILPNSGVGLQIPLAVFPTRESMIGVKEAFPPNNLQSWLDAETSDRCNGQPKRLPVATARVIRIFFARFKKRLE
jgi:hypothetical protein